MLVRWVSWRDIFSVLTTSSKWEVSSWFWTSSFHSSSPFSYIHFLCVLSWKCSKYRSSNNTDKTKLSLDTVQIKYRILNGLIKRTTELHLTLEDISPFFHKGCSVLTEREEVQDYKSLNRSKYQDGSLTHSSVLWVIWVVETCWLVLNELFGSYFETWMMWREESRLHIKMGPETTSSV